MQVSQDGVEARFTLHLPARGRRIAGEQAVQLLCECVPSIVENSLFYSANDPAAISRYIATSEDSCALRAQLKEQNLIAFIADESILPRRSGIDDRPLQSGAVPFKSPQSLRVRMELPHAGPVSGMGIRPGVTLRVGGGFHETYRTGEAVGDTALANVIICRGGGQYSAAGTTVGKRQRADGFCLRCE